MAVELGTGYITLLPSARGFRAAIEKEIGRDVESAGGRAGDKTSQAFGARFSSGLKKVAKLSATGFAAAFAGAAILGKQSIDAASNLNEAQTKVNVVFGKGAPIVTKWAKAAATGMGQSTRSALEAAGTFGNLFQAFGVGQKPAQEMSTKLVQLASDMASFNNLSPQEALDALRSGLSGETEPLKRFGVSLSDVRLKEEAVRLGLIKTTKDALTPAAKSQAAYALIMQDTALTQGDFARTSDGLANQQRILNARFEDSKAAVGAALLPAMTSVVSVLADKVIPKVQELAQKWMPYLRQGFEVVSAWVKENWPQIRVTVEEVMNRVRAVIVAAVDIIRTIWTNFGDQIQSIAKSRFGYVITTIRSGFQVIQGIFQTVMAILHGDWGKAWEGIKLILSGVWNAMKAQVLDSLNTIKNVLSAAWEVIAAVFRSAWNGIVNFFRDHVLNPLGGFVGNLRDKVVSTIQDTVNRAKSVWNGLTAIYTAFVNNVSNPVISAVDRVRDAVVSAFRTAVDGVQTVWDRLQRVVKAPIELVIKFYNHGIAAVWNAVITKIGLPSLPTFSEHLAKGGRVPGSGNRDTVPAMLTPGEFVVTKKAAERWGPKVLGLLNEGPNGTVDPGIFGYAAGGPVRSVDEVQAWMWQQAGKPYVFPLTGPGAYDCSGFTSALVNFALGAANPYSRRHSSGSVGLDSALAPGDGPDPYAGITIGARPPYTLNRSGHLVGHTTATVGGLPGEATPPAVRIGPGARGFDALPMHYHMKNYAGLSELDKGIVSDLVGLSKTAVPSFGDKFPADIITKMVADLPGRVFKFLTLQMPQMIISAVAKAVGKAFSWLNPFDSHERGGLVRRDAPMLVGERRPEVVWGSRGEFVQSQVDSPRNAGIYGIPPVHIHNYTREPTASQISTGIRMAQLQMA